MTRPRGRPVTEHDYQQVKALHAKGLGRNEIARQLGRSGKTVSLIAAELGLSFERQAPLAAVEARKADARARRAALALALLEDAERMRQQLFAPALVYNFGGRDNTFEQATIPEPDFRGKRDLMNAIGIAVERSIRLDEYDRDAQGVEAAKSMLGALATGLGMAWEQLQQQQAKTDAGS